MSIMRTTVILEAERNGKKYQLITPKETSVGEIFDVASEFMAHAIEMIKDIEKESEKIKAEAQDKLEKLTEAEKEKQSQN